MTFLYPTASSVACFLQGFHIEQAYQIQYKESVNKIPIYGYNDYTYSKIAVGRNLIQGILVINFIFPGYLNAVLDPQYNSRGAFVPSLYNYGFSQKGQSQKDLLVKSIEQEIRTELPPNNTPEERAARASYISTLISKDKNTKEATKKALSNFWVAQSNKFIDTDIPSPLTIDNNDTFLDVYYQDPTFENWFIRFHQVHFYEVSQVVSQAGAEGSADNLYEVYSFISNKRVIKRIGEVQ
jgi:hypothetical protein